jgi:hypothetical protein
MKKQRVLTDKDVKAIIERATQNGREVWRVASEGKIKSIATSASSAAAMDEALIIYDTALERLANR